MAAYGKQDELPPSYGDPLIPASARTSYGSMPPARASASAPPDAPYGGPYQVAGAPYNSAAPFSPLPGISGAYGASSASFEPPPPAYHMPPDIDSRLAAFAARYEVNTLYLPSIRNLGSYDVVYILDDSGSMSMIADQDAPQNGTRWFELQQAVRVVSECHLAVGQSFDAYFLNRGTYRNVTRYEDLDAAFRSAPSGGTNTLATLQRVFQDKAHAEMARPLIVHIFTDGHPTNAFGQEDTASLQNYLASRPHMRRTFISFVLCTDDEDIELIYRPWEYRVRGVMGWRGPTCGIPGVDVTEDYRGELRDVRRVRGMRYRFSYGDYIVKVLMGVVDPAVHAVDLPAGANIYGSSGGGCCTIL